MGQKVSIHATVASGSPRSGDQLTLSGVSSGAFDFSTGESDLEFLLPQAGSLALAVRWMRGDATLASARVPIEVAAGQIGLDRLSALARAIHRMCATVNDKRASAYVGERLVAERKWDVFRSTDTFGLDADVRVVHVFRTGTYSLLAYFSGGTAEGFVSQVREAMAELSAKGEELGTDAIKVTDGPPDPEAIGTFVAHWRVGFPEGRGVEMLVTLVRVHTNYEVRVSLSPAD